MIFKYLHPSASPEILLKQQLLVSLSVSHSEGLNDACLETLQIYYLETILRVPWVTLTSVHSSHYLYPLIQVPFCANKEIWTNVYSSRYITIHRIRNSTNQVQEAMSLIEHEHFWMTTSLEKKTALYIHIWSTTNYLTLGIYESLSPWGAH